MIQTDKLYFLKDNIYDYKLYYLVMLIKYYYLALWHRFGVMFKKEKKKALLQIHSDIFENEIISRKVFKNNIGKNVLSGWTNKTRLAMTW